jgi:hypothetical protein
VTATRWFPVESEATSVKGRLAAAVPAVRSVQVLPPLALVLALLLPLLLPVPLSLVLPLVLPLLPLVLPLLPLVLPLLPLRPVDAIPPQARAAAAIERSAARWSVRVIREDIMPQPYRNERAAYICRFSRITSVPTRATPRWGRHLGGWRIAPQAATIVGLGLSSRVVPCDHLDSVAPCGLRVVSDTERSSPTTHLPRDS